MDAQTTVDEPKNGTIDLAKQEAARVLGISLGTIDRLIANNYTSISRSTSSA